MISLLDRESAGREFSSAISALDGGAEARGVAQMLVDGALPERPRTVVFERDANGVVTGAKVEG